MHDIELLPDAARKNLLRALESAVAVRHRGALFLWCQGALNALVPHGIVLLVSLQAGQGIRAIDCLHAVPLPDETLARLREPQQAFPRRLAEVCHERGACTLVLDDANAGGDPAVDSLMAALAPLRVLPGLLHCTGPVPEEGLAILLLGLSGPVTPGQRLVLEVLSPQMLLASLRARQYAGQREVAPRRELPRLGLTERQMEILHWVKVGKTNSETAAILAVSELTVKNHLQRAFRKLDVHNRAQAVAKLMAANEAFE